MKDSREKDFKTKKHFDQESFGRAYEVFAPKILRHIYLRVNSFELAQDFTSQTFLQAWQFISRSKKEISNLKAFLFRVAHNLVIDYYRKKKDVLLEKIEKQKESFINPDTAFKIDLREKAVLVKKAVLGLKEPYRQFLLWRYLDELSIKEISELSGRNANNISVILHRGLKKLKESLKKHEDKF